MRFINRQLARMQSLINKLDKVVAVEIFASRLETLKKQSDLPEKNTRRLLKELARLVRDLHQQVKLHSPDNRLLSDLQSMVLSIDKRCTPPIAEILAPVKQDEWLHQFKTLALSKNRQRISEQLLTHTAIKNNCQHFIKLKELYYRKQQEISDLANLKFDLKSLDESKRYTLINQLTTCYEQAAKIKQNILRYFNNIDYEAIEAAIQRQQLALRVNFQNLLLDFGEERKKDRRRERFTEGIFEYLKSPFASCNKPMVEALKQQFLNDETFHWHPDFSQMFIQDPENTFISMMEQLHLYQKMNTILHHKIIYYLLDRMQVFLKENITASRLIFKLFTEKCLLEKARDNLKNLENFQQDFDAIRETKKRSWESFVKVYNPDPLDDSHEKIEKKLIGELQKNLQTIVKLSKGVRVNLHQLYLERSKAILQTADNDFSHAMRAAALNVLDDNHLIAEFLQFKKRYFRQFSASELASQLPLPELQSAVKDYVFKFNQYSRNVRGILVEQRKKRALSLMDTTCHLKMLLSRLPVIIYDDIFKPFEFDIFYHCRAVEKLLKEEDICLDDCQKKVEKHLGSAKKSLKIFKHLQNEIPQRLENPLYQNSLQVLLEIQKEYIRVFKKYAKPQTDFVNIQSLDQSKTGINQRALDKIDPRLYKLIGLYMRISAANHRYINIDTRLCDDRNYQDSLGLIINHELKQFTSYSDHKWYQFFRMYVLKPLKEFMEEYGLIQPRNPNEFFRTPCASMTEEMVLNNMEVFNKIIAV